MTRPTCHPHRRHCAKGKCRPCYIGDYRRRGQARYWSERRRPCNLCGREYTPKRTGSVYCSKVCLVVATETARAARRGSTEGVEYIATRDPGTAREIVRSARGRGCRVVDRHWKSRASDGAFVAAWHRGGGLYLVRVRWPLIEEEAA